MRVKRQVVRNPHGAHPARTERFNEPNGSCDLHPDGWRHNTRPSPGRTSLSIWVSPYTVAFAAQYTKLNGDHHVRSRADAGADSW